MKRPLYLLRPAWIAGAFFAVFLAARIALYTVFHEVFADLSAADLARALVRGFVIDASIITVSLGPAILALLLPFRFATHELWRATWAWLAFALLCVHALVLAGDIVYFGYVGRHVGVEAVAFSDDPRLMFGIVVEKYLGLLFAVVAAIVLCGFLWRRGLAWDRRTGTARTPAWVLLALAPVFVVAIRGNVVGKPIGTVDAFESGSISGGYLALNGPFSIVHSIPNADALPSKFMPWDDAVAEVRAQVFSDADRALDAEYPLWRARDAASRTRPNVVILLLEGWDGDAVDSVRVQRGQEPLGVTPCFDALSKQGVLFTEFYASGQRTMHGMLAVLAGLPSLPGLPYLGSGVEQSRMTFLGRLALAEGYATHFLRGAHERSFRLDSVSALAGFEQYLGMERISAITGRPPMARWGVWDGDLMQTAHDKFVASPKPFLGLVFTTSTHPPFQIPKEHPRPYPDDTDLHSYWNSMHYADASLGKFIDSARQAGYYDDTVFVIVSDHRSGVGLKGLSFPEMHHVPCLVIAPGLAPRIERGVRSQLDVLPTIAELAHWSTPQATLGRSLLDPGSDERGALCMRSELLVRIESSGWVVHNLARRLSSKAVVEGADLAAIERRLLAAVQVTVTALRSNRVEPAPPPATASAR